MGSLQSRLSSLKIYEREHKHARLRGSIRDIRYYSELSKSESECIFTEKQQIVIDNLSYISVAPRIVS